METEKAFAAKCEEYAEAHGLRELMQSLMRLLLQQRPEDPLQFLIDHLKQQEQLESQDELQQKENQNGHQQQGPALRLIMLGLPRSGRREASRRLAEMWGLPLVSTGDLLRLHAEKYPEGEAARALATKTLASDELTIDLVSKRMEQQQQLLQQRACNGWILDGFPRTRRQAVALLQLRLSPDRCCLLVPSDERAKAALRASVAAAAASAAAAAESFAASDTGGPHFRSSSSPATERQARLRLTKEADARLQLAYRHLSGVLDVLGPLAETVPAEGNLSCIVDMLKARCGVEGDSRIRLLPPKICVIGGSGSGKSTQCRLLSKRFGVVHVDTRELLLQRAQDDEECRKALLELASGVDFSFDPLLAELVAGRLAAADCARRGWVLEGFPSTAHQAKLLRHHKIIPECIFYLEVPEGTLVDRIARCKVGAETSKASYGSSSEPGKDVSESRKNAARLVELRTAQLERWLPAIREAFPGKLTTLCSDDAVSVESVAQRILEVLSRHRMSPMKSR